MGSTVFNDVAQPFYWIFSAAAVLVLAFTASQRHYRSTLAIVNLFFCVLIVGWNAVSILVMSIAFLHWTCQLKQAIYRLSCVSIIGGILLLCFVVHKLPESAWNMTSAAKPVFAAIGFSYVFLRCVEYVRASTVESNISPTFAETINYLVPFHMLAAGPVMAFSEFRRLQTPSKYLTKEEALSAFELIASGLFRKFVLANGLIEPLFLTGFKSEGLLFFVEVQLYYIYIYLDFSAYTNIALGIGRLLRVPTPVNFNNPLAARNIIDFWERWHISLSQFIRRNVFIPIQLAGMRWTNGRNGRLVSSFGFFSAFLICGLWHGISLRFVCWGCGHAIALIICNAYRDFLVFKLGRKGATTFSESRLVKYLATFITFEFVAFSLAFLALPYSVLAI